MAIQRQLRRGTAAENDVFTGAPGEIVYITDDNEIAVHDGLNAGGHRLASLDGAEFTGPVTFNNLLTAEAGVFTNIEPRNADADPSTYPDGMSTMKVTGYDQDWPADKGSVITYILSRGVGQRITQFFIEKISLNLWYRTRNENDTAWEDFKQIVTASGSAPVYACRAWVNFNGTGTVAIRASGNVSSISDLGTGQYRTNFTTALSDTNYSVAGSCWIRTSSYSETIHAYASSTSYADINLRSGSAGTNPYNADNGYISVSIHR